MGIGAKVTAVTILELLTCEPAPRLMVWPSINPSTPALIIVYRHLHRLSQKASYWQRCRPSQHPNRWLVFHVRLSASFYIGEDARLIRTVSVSISVDSTTHPRPNHIERFPHHSDKTKKQGCLSHRCWWLHPSHRWLSLHSSPLGYWQHGFDVGKLQCVIRYTAQFPSQEMISPTPHEIPARRSLSPLPNRWEDIHWRIHCHDVWTIYLWCCPRLTWEPLT